MSAQGLLNSVFSCSSLGYKTVSKRKLRQSRSLDPALIRNDGTEPAELTLQTSLCLNPSQTGGPADCRTPAECFHSKTLGRKQHRSSSSLFGSSDVWSRPDIQLDCDVRSTERSAWDFTFSLRGPLQSAHGGSGTVFSPRKWLQKRIPHAENSDTFSYNICMSEGDFTWRSECGRSFRLMPVALQSLSELERVRLQDVAFTRLLQDYDLGCQITIPKDGHKTKKSLKSKLDSLSKEKRDKEYVPQAFAVTLQQVIANDRWLKLRQEAQDYEDQKEHVDLAASSLYLVRRRLNQREFSSSNSSLSSCCETPNESATPGTPESRPHARRRGGVSVDCITDLDDGQSRLLEALQLSLPAESLSTKKKARDTKLSLNPIYRQVPRVVDWCCRHLETYGLQTVGIFRVGSSRKRVRQLREEFDQGVEVDLGPEHSVHDVAALLKEFLRDMPDPLLTRELYTAFINCTLLDAEEQNTVLQLLVCLLPACNSDTLQCILHFLSKVAAHAEDSHDREGRQLTGNKMTSHNLATILGPNILHKRKSSDKEFSVQTSAQVEDSAAIISVVQRMITCHTALFTVPAELQHEVLVSLVETDYDVVDYLLRRKTSHRESPTTPHQRQPLCLSKCGSSSDSNRASSGETSPYDNASPTLSQRLLSPEPGYSGLRPSPERSLLNRPVSAETSLPPAPRHTLTEAFPSHLGNKKSLRRTQTTAEETRPHPPVTRAHSSPLSDRPLDQMCQSPTTPPWQRRTTSAWYQSDESVLASPMSPFSARYNGRLPPPYTGLPKPPSSTLQTSAMSHQPPSSTLQPTEGLNFHGPRCTPTSHGGPPTPTCPQTYTSHPAVGGCQDWQTDKWQIWHLLSSDNPDTPETLV